MLIASKFEEIYAPQVDEFVYISDNTYTRQQILKMEGKILHALDFRLHTATPKLFQRRFLRACRATNLEKMLACYFLELHLLEIRFTTYLPDLIAAGCLYLSRTTLKVRARTFKIGDPSTDPLGPGLDPAAVDRHPWTPTLHHYSGYGEEQLADCAEELRKMHVEHSGPGGKKKNGGLHAIFEKYSSDALLHVAAINPLTSHELKNYKTLPIDEKKCFRKSGRWDEFKCIGHGKKCRCVKHGHEIVGRPPWEPKPEPCESKQAHA